MTFIQQNKILKKHFGLTVKVPKKTYPLAEGAEGIYLVPSWNRIAPTYSEALLKVLAAIKSTRPFFNYREGEIDEKRLRHFNHSDGVRAIPEIIHAQLGKKHKGISVENVRKQYDTGKEYLLGAYEVGIILLLNPNILKSYNDLWIDCPGDEYDYPVSDVRFDNAPIFHFNDGKVKFDTDWISHAYERYGSASGLVPQSNLETRSLAPIAPLTLDTMPSFDCPHCQKPIGVYKINKK